MTTATRFFESQGGRHDSSEVRTGAVRHEHDVLKAAYAVALATRGAAVVVNDLGSSPGGDGTDSEPAAAVTAAIDASGGRAIANLDDVSTAAGAQRMITVALETFGRIDVVINNAGIVNRSTFPDTTLEDMQRHIAVHQIGTFNVSRAAWPHMVRQKYGRMIATLDQQTAGERAGLIRLAGLSRDATFWRCIPGSR